MRQGNPLGIDETGRCAAKRSAFSPASYQLTVNVPEYNKECAAAGKDQIQTSEFQDTRQAISALTSGRQDAVLADSPILDFAVTQNPDDRDRLALRLHPGRGRRAQGRRPDQARLRSALRGDHRATPTSKVLGKYGLESSAITDARVNFAQ